MNDQIPAHNAFCETGVQFTKFKLRGPTKFVLIMNLP